MCRPQKAEGAFPQRQALPVSLLPKVARHPFPAPFLFHRKAFPSSDAIAQGSRRYDEQGVSVRPPAGGIGSLLAQYAGVVVGQFRSGVRRGVVEYRLLWRAAFDSLCPCPVADTQREGNLFPDSGRLRRLAGVARFYGFRLGGDILSLIHISEPTRL